MEEQLGKSLGQFFDHYTVDEWIEQHLKPLEIQVDDLMEKAKTLNSKSVWPKRPLESPSVSLPVENPLNQMPRGKLQNDIFVLPNEIKIFNF